MIKIYNTLTRQKEEFRPIENGKVRMYVCGPTVYDVPHIGHARSAYVFEIIRRYFEYKGFDVLFVRNVTDVDDKIINKAVRELKDEGKDIAGDGLKDKTREVAKRYLDVYHAELVKFGIRPPVVEPKATENIKEMIRFIGDLIKKGYAYPADGSVYFDVEKFPGYGKLSKQNTDEMMHGARADVDENKKQPLDFALWKKAKPGEPSWPSPWGEGRPGWHIECSVMSTKILGTNFDIHGGGLDLIFPHHENEIAQAEAWSGCRFANYWMHNGLLTVGGEKMSKSLGNYLTIADFLKKYKDPDLLKMTFLNSHYRSPVDYGDAKIEEMRSSKERIVIFLDKAKKLAVSAKRQAPSAKCHADEIIRSLSEKFESAMDDDLNTPQALSVIFEAVRCGNEFLAVKDEGEDKQDAIIALSEFIIKAANVLGLSLHTAGINSGEAAEIEGLIAAREKARKEKKYKEADDIRRKLTEMGVTIEDTPEGTIWRKK